MDRAILGADALLTPAEAAALLGVSPATLRRMRAAGRIARTCPSPGVTRYRLGAVQAAIRGAEERPAEAPVATGRLIGLDRSRTNPITGQPYGAATPISGRAAR